jgi:maltose/moltooligosaccharide transporter
MERLNYKRTFLVGLAFLSICSFWQLYDSIIPLILKNTFNIGDTISGVVMAMDNVLAIFLLPIFGALSDRTQTKYGKRKPFIVIGTSISVILMLFLPIVDNSYSSSPSSFLIVLFIIILGLLLISMGIYRSPAVALMPDVTPKPLRSKANAVINLMGSVGGILYLLIASLLYSSKKDGGHVDYLPLFICVAMIMVVSVLILVFSVDENKFHKEMQEYENKHPEDNLEVKDKSGKSVLPREVKKSLVFLLMSIFFWFMGYNAVTTAFTKYADKMWNMTLGSASMCLTIATVGAIIAFIPIGFLSSKIGRKKTIMGGVILLSLCFAAAFIYTLLSPVFSFVLYILFILVGISWASINVNSLPMVVEMCKGSDTGKFTGYYYTFSMAAQIVTPILSGALLQFVGYSTLFPYAAIFAGLSFVTMIFVKHGDNRPKMPKDKLEMMDVDT